MLELVVVMFRGLVVGLMLGPTRGSTYEVGVWGHRVLGHGGWVSCLGGF